MISLIKQSIDFLIVATFLVVIFVLGISRKFALRDIRDFSVGDCNYSTPLLFASTFSALISGLMTIGLAGFVFADGLWPALALAGIAVQETLIAVLIAPRIGRFAGMISVGDIMESLYGVPVKFLTGLATVLSNVFVLGAQFCALGFLIQYCLNVPYPLAIFFASLAFIPYAARGGIKAIKTAHVVHFGVLVFALPLVAFTALYQTGGYENLIALLPANHIDLSIADPRLTRFAGVFLIFALPALYPIMIQRMLMARDGKQARQVLLLKASATILFLLVPTTIGLIARAHSPSLSPNLAFAFVISEKLPHGVIGIGLAGMTAVFLSTTDSFLNSISVAIAHDVIGPLKKSIFPRCSELITARVATVAVGLSTALIAVYFQSVLLGIMGSMNIWLPFFFPPLFLGMLGLQKNKSDFWIGGGVALAVWILASTLTSFASPWAILSATSASLFTLILRALYARIKLPNWAHIKKRLKIIQIKLKPDETRVPEYSLFASLTLMGSLLPIFFSAYQGQQIDSAIFLLQLIAAGSCFVLLIKDHLARHSDGYWRYHWIVSLLFCLPVLSTVLLVQSGFAFTWICDFVLVAFILWAFTERILFWVLLPLGSLLGLGIAKTHMSTCHFLLDAFHLPHLLIALHILSLLVCFVVFRRRDFETIREIRADTKTTVHSINKPLSEFSIEAKILAHDLPVLFEAYEFAKDKCPGLRRISAKRLRFLDELPEKMKRNTERLQTLVNTILGKAAPNAGSISVLQSVSAVLNHFPEVEIESTSDFEIRGKADILELVLVELLKNANEAIAQSKRGSISIRVNEESNELSIQDSASGISAHFHEKVFEERFTTKPKGSGLGLYFCRTQMANLGGHIRCTSQEGDWTRFVLTFPRHKKDIE